MDHTVCRREFCPNTKAYGWSFWIKHGSLAKTIVKSGGGQHIKTSNQAEVEALRQGILEVRKLDFKGRRIVVQSDLRSQCARANAQVSPPG